MTRTNAARVLQAISAVPAVISRTWFHQARRARLILLPRLDRGALFIRGKKEWVRWDLVSGQRVELDAAAGVAQLAELEALAKAQAEAAAPEVLRGRWTARAMIRDGGPVIELRRVIGYVTAEILCSAGSWKVQPFKRRPAWFSLEQDWPQVARTAATPRAAIALALEQAEAGITLACTRRDSTRREPPRPAAPRKPRAKPAPAPEAAPKPTRGLQKKLF